jgi:predicted N-acyltransferase
LHQSIRSNFLMASNFSDFDDFVKNQVVLAQRTIKSERFEREKLRQHIDFRATYRRQLTPTDRRLL